MVRILKKGYRRNLASVKNHRYEEPAKTLSPRAITTVGMRGG